jgi:hypothetical protein
MVYVLAMRLTCSTRLIAAASMIVAAFTVGGSEVNARVEPDVAPDVVVVGDTTTRNHEIAYNPERNEYYAVWEDFGVVSSQIFGQRLAADGAPLGAPTLIAAQGDGNDGDLLQGAFMPPKVAYNPATNQYLVVFGRSDTGAAQIEQRRAAVVLGRLVSAVGTPVGGEVPLNPKLGNPDPGFQGACYPRFPDVVANPNTGGYVLAYTKIFYGTPSRGTCDGLGSEVTTTLQALNGSLARGTRVDVLTNSEEGTPVPALGFNPVTNQILVTRPFTELRGGANRDGRRFEAQVFNSALSPAGPIRTIDVDPVQPSNAGSVVRAIPVADPTTGNWFVASTTRFAGTIWTNLLGRTGASLRTGTRSDSGIMQSVDSVGDGTFVFSTNRGDVFHVRADGSEIHDTTLLPGSIYETPSLAMGADGRGVVVGIGQGNTVSYGFTVVAPAVLPLVPARVLDTREGFETVDGVSQGQGRVRGGRVLVLQVAGRGGVPDGARAVNLNITADRPAGDGFVVAYPCDASRRPNTSNLNHVPGGTVAAAAFARLSSAGTVCLFSPVDVDLIVDVNGFTPGGGSVEPLVPTRLLETRGGFDTIDGVSEGQGRVRAGSTTTLRVADRGGVDPDADAVLVNATALNPSADVFLTIYPCDEDRPDASNVNANRGAVVNNLVLAKVSAAGTICIFSSVETDVLVDVAGYVPESGGLLSIVPARLIDTRFGFDTVDGLNEGAGRVGTASVTTLQVAGRGGVDDGATGAVLNLVAVAPDGPGFMTAYPCDEDRPNASNVNFVPGRVVSNSVVVKLSSSGTVCLFSTSRTDIVVDVVGYSFDS